MPSNQINPFNYNIDNFDSGILGPTTDTNFRTYLFTHNLPTANSVISGILGGNPWQDRGLEYDVSQSNPSVIDVPNLQDVAQTPSLYNNLTNPRQVNLTNNLQNLNPDVQNVLGQTTPIQAGLGQDATTLFNPTISNLDLPSVEEASQVASEINNFTTPKYDNLDKNATPLELLTWNSVAFGAVYQQYSSDYDTSYGVPQTLKIGYVGNIEEWVNPGGNVTTTNEARRELFSPANNKWGPTDMIAYEMNGGDEVVVANTGLIQYSTGVQGDFRDQLLSRSLGVGIIPFSTIGSGINFKPDGTNISQLDEIARKRRGVELLNRIKLNFTDDTVGRLNVSPFKLLGGGNLIEQNYTITVPKSGLGKAAQFAADLAGFNLPTSIIPAGAFGKYGVDGTSNGREIDISNDILDYTGSGQKSLLYNALYINKYGPNLQSAAEPPTTSLGKILKEKLGAGQAPNTQNYLTYQSTTPQNNGTRNTSIIDNINQKVKNVLNKSNGNAESLRSTVFEDTSDVTTVGSDKYGGFYGKYEPFESVGRSFSEQTGFGQEDAIFEVYDSTKPKTTYNGSSFELYSSTDQQGVTTESVDWRKRNKNPFTKGILGYTQKLVNDSKLRSATGYIGYFDSDGKEGALTNGAHQTGVNSPNLKPTNPSKGNVSRNYNFKDNTGGDYYCRSWSSRRKYHTWDNLVRSNGNWWRNQIDQTDLTMNYDGNNGGDFTGMPKITWNSLDNLKGLVSNTDKLKGEMIPYMFSIENLAWKDAPQKFILPKCEIGPNEGRIMWFPPYDINFSESTSVSWDNTTFIGRGEPIYTYNHTERSGTLDWKIIIDHSNTLNQLRKNFEGNILGDEGYNSYFAGCDNDTLRQLFADYLPENNDLITPDDESVSNTIQPCEPASPPDNNIRIYFDNSRSSKDSIGRVVDLEKYEVTVPSLVNVNENSWNTDGTTYPCGPAGDNSYKYLNVGVNNRLKEIAKFLVSEDGKNYKIKVIGYTSPANPDVNYNKQLGLERARNAREYLLKLMVENDTQEVYLEGNKEYGTYPKETELQGFDFRWEYYGKVAEPEGEVSKCTPSNDCLNTKGQPSCCDGNPCDSLDPGQANSRIAKELRYAEITLEKDLTLQNRLLLELQKKEQSTAKLKKIEYIKNRQITAQQVAKAFVTECDYFEDMKRNQPFVYQSIAEKVKYFHPAFHSMTPEGFNSRLTFLQQCTRQGPQIIDQNSPSNMIFGRPPICVLRIGDFYHTKIVIDSLNIDYEPLQWDLNPEGIGVQPMVAKVSIGFKFIGGSSLGGPIRQLQNAVSYNFFANTSVYNPATQPLPGELGGTKMPFIYGAFRSPEEERLKMDLINKINLKAAEDAAQKQNDNSSNTTAPTTNAPIDGGTLPEIEIVAPKSDVTGTQGDNKPPTDGNVNNQSDKILTISKNNSGIQLQVNDTNWTLLNVEVDVTDNTGILSIQSKSYGGNFDQDTITNVEVHDAIIQTFSDCPGKGCTLFDPITGNVEPNVNCTYIIQVVEKNNFPNGQKKTYNTTNTVKI